MIEKKPFKIDLIKPESHFRGEKSHPLILIEGEDFHRCRIYGIRVFVDFVKFQSILRKWVARTSTLLTFIDLFQHFFDLFHFHLVNGNLLKICCFSQNLIFLKN
jgi:hypothetical protein